MIHLIREISKLSMFTIIWLIPVQLSRWNNNNSFLWLFILSLIITLFVFFHYEDLEKNDNPKDDNNECQ